MKTISVLALALFVLTSAAFADMPGVPITSGQPDNDFLARKQEVLGNLNQRITHLSVLPKMYTTAQQILELQKKQRCVENSQSHVAMKNCLNQAHTPNALSIGKSAR